MSPQEKLESLGLELPPAPKPAGVYKPVVVVGNLAYVSGHGPLQPNKTLMTGRLGLNLDIEVGYEAAKLAGLGILMTMQNHFGSINKIKRVIKLLGLVQCVDGFPDSPAVINGCSELLRDIFGEENGVGARSAIGTNSLPGGMAVEVEAIFELND